MSSNQNNWEACDHGVIDAMVEQEQAAQQRQSRRDALRTMVMGSVACACGLSAYSLARRSGGSQGTAEFIACEDVHANLQDFVDNKIADQHLRGLISRHLFQCSSCQEAYRGMINDADFDCSV
jgi:hypothetical protein